LCNRVGVEGGITFGGGSFVALPNSDIAGRAENGEQLLRFELHREEIERSRRPYAHIRDESPWLVNRELQRILSG
jgi:predicted amidohydrolase